MRLRLSAFRPRLSWAAFAALLFLGLTACRQQDFPQSTLFPRGDFARMVDQVFMTTVKWAVVVFVLVEGLLVFAILKFRGRPNDPEPRQIHGNTTVEIVWTIIPALILALIAVPTVRAVFKTYQLPTENVVDVQVIGHQWWWEFRYPKAGVVTAGDLHVPVGQTVALRMTTEDVLHSFWVPQFAGKRDVFPNRNNVLYFKAEVPGNYSGQCAEFCGVQHGRMGFRIVSESPAEFQTYLERLRATGSGGAGAPAAQAAPKDSATRTTTVGATVPVPAQTPKGKGAAPAPQAAQPAAPAAPADPQVAIGDSLFHKRYGCVGCHSLDATKPMGVGPNLANVGSRSYIAAGTLRNTDENLALWIENAQAIKHGVLMPNLGVTPADAKALVAYLRTHK